VAGAVVLAGLRPASEQPAPQAGVLSQSAKRRRQRVGFQARRQARSGRSQTLSQSPPAAQAAALPHHRGGQAFGIDTVEGVNQFFEDKARGVG